MKKILLEQQYFYTLQVEARRADRSLAIGLQFHPEVIRNFVNKSSEIVQGKNKIF